MTANRSTPRTKAEQILSLMYGPRIRQARKALGMKLQQLAEMIPMDYGLLSRVERQERACSLESLSRLGGILGLPDLVRAAAYWQVEQEVEKRRGAVSA